MYLYFSNKLVEVKVGNKSWNICAMLLFHIYYFREREGRGEDRGVERETENHR